MYMQECTYNSMNEMMYTRIRTHTHTHTITHTHTHTHSHADLYIYTHIYIACTSCQTDSRLCRRALDARMGGRGGGQRRRQAAHGAGRARPPVRLLWRARGRRDAGRGVGGRAGGVGPIPVLGCSLYKMTVATVAPSLFCLRLPCRSRRRSRNMLNTPT
jgi:hypothetical protein